MSPNKDQDQDSSKQRNIYADSLRRVRRVGRTLEVSIQNLSSREKEPSQSSKPAPHESQEQPPSQSSSPASHESQEQPSSQSSSPASHESQEQPSNQSSSQASQGSQQKAPSQSISSASNESQEKPSSPSRVPASHESIKDQAVSRKTRRPAEDYEVAKTFLLAEEQGDKVPPGEIAEAKKAEGTSNKQPEQIPTKTSPNASDNPRTPVAKTKLFSDHVSSEKPKRRASQQFVAKTLIDHTAIREAQSHFSDRHNARVEQEISNREHAPTKVIEPIKAQKKIDSCPFSWNDESPSENFKHCSNCQTTIYSLDGMEFSEVENLIFKRENRKKFVLYKRPDGKFMTSDCPVAQKRRQQFVGLVALCIFLIACVGGVLMLMPPAPPPTADNSLSEPAPSAVSTETRSADATSPVVKKKGTSQHYEAGDTLPEVPKSEANNSFTQTPQAPPTPQNFSDSEQSGDFWEFPNGK